MYRSDNEIVEFLADSFPLMSVIMLSLFFILVIVYFIIKNADNKKELIIKKVKILEKPIEQGSTAWYIVECEDGKRIKLRSFNADKIIIMVGDEGIIKYRGQTIQSFER